MNNRDEKNTNPSNPDDRDRTVPSKENFYKKDSPYSDFNFNQDESERKSAADEIINHQNDNGGMTDINAAFTDYENDEIGARYYTPEEMYGTQQSYSGSTGTSNGKKKKKKKRKKKQGRVARREKIIAALVIILIIILIPVLLVTPVMGRVNYDSKLDGVTESSALYSESGVTNILLLGVDARSEDSADSSRSDSMMLMSVNTKNRSIKLTSFLRDSWMYIPSVGGNQRLNAACSYGGYQGVVDALEYNYGIEIEGYLVADFEMFQVMVDKIGGVEITVTEEEANEVNNHPGTYGDVTLKAGTYSLDGEQALAYCRIRKVGTDWARTERQRTVMEEILNELLHSNPVTMYSTVYNVAPYLETNLSRTQLISVAAKAVIGITGGFESAACPFDGTWSYATISGASVISLDIDANKEKLIEFIYG